MTCSELDDSIYLIGARSANSTENDDLLRFDPVAELWTQLPDMPTARWQTASAAIGNDIYVFGGNNSYCCNNWFHQEEGHHVQADE